MTTQRPTPIETVRKTDRGPVPPRDQPDDEGTRALLRAGSGTLLAGILAALLTATVFGGISAQGPHTNAGWLSLMVAMMCLPFGLMLFALGAAKWFRNRRLRRILPR